ncbi:DUF4405 domain-containing protein [Adlercreutzia sp. ZJ138]|uniref:DUF4405 domain-containing protein n=1 Tax=Adlercreutzia sp. ZJ138 TaxID=2709405 RepID=UPI0013EB09EC|nr:DUF4405 domain-containing protein [Adlercreutzia sp. ZJ138]
MDLRKVLAVDAVVLVVYVLVANPVVTGVPVHEWVGLGALLFVIVHAAMHVDYLLDTFFHSAHRRGVKLVKTILDIVLVLVFMTCCVSGLMVSGTVLSSLGLYADGYYFWDLLHAASAKLLLALLLVHVASNWKIVVAGMRRSPAAGVPGEGRCD